MSVSPPEDAPSTLPSDLGEGPRFHDRRMRRRVFLSALLGSTVEYYDFMAYAVAATLVFGPVFFAPAGPNVQLVLSFASLAIGFAVRPLGGIVLGHFGDRYSRKSVLMFSLTMMGICTGLIGVLPSYATAGVTGPVLLIVLRVLQGFAVGGEWGGSVLMSVEHAERRHRGFFGSATPLGVAAGSALAYAVFGLFGLLSDEAFLSWGWRIPFLLTFLLLAVSLYIRSRIAESPEFEVVKENGAIMQVRTPLRELLRRHPRATALGVLAVLGPYFAQSVLSTYGVAFGTAVVGLQRSFLLNLLTITIVVMLVTVPLFGVLGDRFGARRVFWILTALTGVGGLFALPLVATASTPVIWVTYVVQLSVFYAGASAVLPAYLAELLPVDVRFTGVSLCFQLANALGNGFAPLIMVLLVTASGGRTLTASLVVGVLCAISVVAVLVSRPAQATIGKPDFG